MVAQAARGHDLDLKAQTLTQQNAALQQHIKDDEAEIAQAQTPAWLEEEARKLGYVKPGEQVFVLVSPGAQPPQGGGGVDAPLPIFTGTPSPTPSPTPAPSPGTTSAKPSAPAGPTPLIFVVPTPNPSH